MRKFQTHVARGIKFMDKHGPKNWRRKIDLKTLNIRSASDCIIGQLYGDFWDGLNKLKINFTEAKKNGFAENANSFFENNSPLQDEWVRQLTTVKK